MKVLARVRDPVLLNNLRQALGTLGGQLVDTPDSHPDILLVEAQTPEEVTSARAQARKAGAALLVACQPNNRWERELAAADDCIVLPAEPAEIAQRIVIAQLRAAAATELAVSDGADSERWKELLFDKLTGLPTLPVMLESARELLERRGELTVLYIHFVWYEKIEEIYGWHKMDDVLETTAGAVRNFYAQEYETAESIMMVSHVADDDFILFTYLAAGEDAAEPRLRAVAQRLEEYLHTSVEEIHGEDIAALCGIYVGAATVFRNPQIRTERLIYRGIREASQAARGAEQWERARKVSDLRSTIREGAVFIEYHPIIVTKTEEVFGFEALARGIRRELRSPEVLFEVAAEANLVWELSRLLRRRAVQGIVKDLRPDQVLFLNVDPHDFDDPAFRNLAPADLGIEEGRIVFEITERTAIRDYPRFREYLATFRERGFRFAVDDAGSGYAGLGSIANLAPDFIKLDMALISNIDANPLKQNLVETLVVFAEAQGVEVVAEGVERREEFETIKQLGVHYTQGFLFHKPRYSGLPPGKAVRFSHAQPRPRENDK